MLGWFPYECQAYTWVCSVIPLRAAARPSGRGSAPFGAKNRTVVPSYTLAANHGKMRACRERFTWSRRRSGTSRTSRCARCACCARWRSSPARTRDAPPACSRRTASATPTTSFFEHNERWKGERILTPLREARRRARLRRGHARHLRSRLPLVRDARAEGIAVVPVPGPSAAIAALVRLRAADRPLPVRGLPPRARPRSARRRSRSWPAQRETLVVYESPHARGGLAGRHGRGSGATATRSSAARPPSCTRSTCAARSRALRELLAAPRTVKGEIVLVVEGAGEPTVPDGDAEALYAALAAEGRTRREAVKEAARPLGLPAREVYREGPGGTRATERSGERRARGTAPPAPTLRDSRSSTGFMRSRRS